MHSGRRRLCGLKRDGLPTVAVGWRLAIATLLTAQAAAVDVPVPPGPLRILCVGDSITEGGRRGVEEYTYRLPLQRMLHAEGISYEFLGARRGGLDADAVWPEVAEGVPFDPHHEGYYGRRTATVVAKVMADWLDSSPVPDIVLVHLGTNDQGNLPHEQTVQEPLRSFILFLRQKNPRVSVLLGHLNFNDSRGANAIRPLVEALAAELDSAESAVRTVHHYRGWVKAPGRWDSDTFDWLHPNPRGQRKMAEAWWEAIRPLLPGRR